MDYTKVPRELIYRERRSLEEFADNNSLNETLVHNMSHVYYMKSNFRQRALKCMNTAYYICTLMLREKHPEWSFDDYCSIAFCKDNDNKVNQAITLSLVYIYINGLSEEQCGKLQLLKNNLDKFINSISNYLQIGVPFLKDYYYSDALKQVRDGLGCYAIDENEFAFRYIDDEAVSDALLEKDFNWPKFTNYWEERSLRDIIMTLGNTEEEKNNVINVLLETANGFYYTKGYNPNIEEVKKKLNCIDEEIRSHFNSEIEDEQNDQCTKIGDKSEDGNNFGNTNADNGQQKKIIKDLERQLKESQATIEDLTQPVEELNAEQKVRMAFALQLLKAAGLTDEVLEKHGNKAKAASIMSLLLNIISNNSRGNKAQICQTFISDPRYYPRDDNKDTLKRLNSLCSDLGINVCLSIESQSNK